MSCRVLFWLSSCRTLDTKVTKSREMIKRIDAEYDTATGEELRRDSTIYQENKINREHVGCYMAQPLVNTIRGLFEWPVFTLESRSPWGLSIQRSYSISPEGRARSLNDWTTPSACWRHQLGMGMLHQTAFLWISSAWHLQMVQKSMLQSVLIMLCNDHCIIKKTFSVTATCSDHTFQAMNQC